MKDEGYNPVDGFEPKPFFVLPGNGGAGKEEGNEEGKEEVRSDSRRTVASEGVRGKERKPRARGRHPDPEIDTRVTVSRQFNFRLSEDEVFRLKVMAISRRMSVSSYIRMLIKEDFGRNKDRLNMTVGEILSEVE